MTSHASKVLTQEQADARRVRRSDYTSCSVAFIDCKKAGFAPERKLFDHPESALETILGMAEASGNDISAQTALALGRPGACLALSHARYPVLALTGGEDTAAPLSQAREAAGAAPHGKASSLPGLGHYELLEYPQAGKAVLVSNLKELSI